ncbi:MAG TPA: RNA polymerase sigma factor [Candidatus Krumholzibacteria bacterium]
MEARTGDLTLNSSTGKATVADDAVDATLAVAGDGAAFERLYLRHAPRIYGLALRMAQSADPEEMVQEIFVRAWQKLGSFKGEAAFSTWLFRLGVNLILTRRSKLAKLWARELNGDELLVDVPARPSHVDASMDFENALRRLPNGAREVLVLHDVEGFKHGEIGDMLGISVGTSKSQLHRARMSMRKVLRQ